MWNDLFAAIALLLVFEGMMPFLNPERWKNFIRTVAEQPDRTLRIMGLTSMIAGTAFLYLIR